MKRFFPLAAFLIGLCVALTPCADAEFGTQAHPSMFYRSAPDFTLVDGWINSDPLRLADLRGKVVLVEFWTYSCINSLRTIPYLNRWYEQYKDRSFVVVGIHTPEFGFEHKRVNVDDALKQFNIHFPVAQDNEYATWKSYGNHAWPGFYLIDKEGKIVLIRYGEGEYDRTENKIRELLGIKASVAPDDGPDLRGVQTPEMYFGTAHENYQSTRQRPISGAKSYDLPDMLRSNEFALSGTWLKTEEKASLVADHGAIRLRFKAGKVHLVAGADTPTELNVRADGGTPHRVLVTGPRLYTLYDSADYREHTLEIEIPTRGFDAYSFTFG